MNALNQLPARHSAAEALHEMIASGHDQLPLPGKGKTLQRWQALAGAAARDLSLAKLFESHTDALAIFNELDSAPNIPQASWGVWAADSSVQPVQLQRQRDGSVHLTGTKHWCSGAATLSHALVTAWEGERGPFLVWVALTQATLRIDTDGWHAVGMADTGTGTVVFNNTPGTLVGGERAYLQRPGFWQGAGGIAACWYGAVQAIASKVCQGVLRNPRGYGEHALAHVGAIDVALRQASALLRQVADWIDRHPHENAMAAALRVREAVESAAQLVLQRAGRTLGAAAYCNDAEFAQRVADLPVFLRQSHAERDLSALGEAVLKEFATQEARVWSM